MTLANLPIIINTTPPAQRLIPEKSILWPTVAPHGDNQGSDSTRFPSLIAIKIRRAAETPEPLLAFVAAAQTAQERILILDDFLFEPRKGQPPQRRYDQILAWFPLGFVANDVRILTNARGSKFERDSIRQQLNERAANINRMSPRRKGRVVITIKFSLDSEFPYVHDRFAIIDSELWHFGSTVGGLHHDVNAATRGWDADQHNASKFFEQAWQGDDDFVRRRIRG